MIHYTAFPIASQFKEMPCGHFFEFCMIRLRQGAVGESCRESLARQGPVRAVHAAAHDFSLRKVLNGKPVIDCQHSCFLFGSE